MLKRTIAAVLAGLTTVLATAAPASAITYGEPDAGQHPFVGLMFVYTSQDLDGRPDTPAVKVATGRCTGTQMDAHTFLTAGHCTVGAEAVAIWFGEDLRQLPAEHFQFFDQAMVHADAYSTDVHTHPNFDPSGLYQHDVGVADAVTFREGFTLSEYGQLPELGYWDEQNALNRQQRNFYTTVGYGLQRAVPARGKSNPPNSNARQNEALPIKLKSSGELLGNRQFGGGEGNDAYVVLTNNARTGGTCFGDSGGPTFISGTTTVVAVISFVMNSTCSGTSGVHRIDTADNLEWLETYIDNPTP